MMTVKEFLAYGMYLCEYYYDANKEDCKKECPFREKQHCVFPDEMADYDIDFAIRTVEEFQDKIAQPISLFNYMEKVMPYSTNFYEKVAPCSFFNENDFICNTDEKYCRADYEECWKKCTIKVKPDRVKKILKEL